ncbi:MAG: hypothetical protein HY445_03705 [Candidatus Niyogibacteria bacterium]|nr:hypothetical protein [Candidatus Niyogibacteria bacterium]
MRYLYRTGIALGAGIGMFSYPFFFIVGGGLLSGVLFTAFFDVVAIAIVFEILSGTPVGIVSIPMAAAILSLRLLVSHIRAHSLFSFGIMFGIGFCFFLIFHSITLFVYGETALLSDLSILFRL